MILTHLFAAFLLIYLSNPCILGDSYTANTGDLTGILKHYETIHHTEISHRVKRSADGSEEKLVHFRTLGREFHLKLHRKSSITSPDFKVVSIDSQNNEREVVVDTQNLYHGVDMNDPSSDVQAYWEDESMVATIKTDEDVYILEPSWRQLPESTNFSMISYKNSDVMYEKDLGKHFCGYVNADKDEASYESFDHTADKKAQENEAVKRDKRETNFRPTKNRCPVLLVADYRFFRQMGQSSHSKTTSYLIGLIDRVDKIYQETDFGNGFIGMGFEIKEVRIHEAPTVPTGGQPHYNEERELWDTKPLLEQFSADSRFQAFCLAHLFTHQPFDGGVLGLAYIASPRTYSVGGVCSSSYYKGGSQLFLNTGWSSSLNRYNRRLLTSEADLVTTHEFGHNWGSEHDPDTSECAPNSYEGGKHIMYTYSVSGYDANNKKFSPCSQRSIGAVLESKHEKCFTAPQAAFCGNNNVEPGEDCDVGPETKKGTNPCCDRNCRFKPKAVCSDVNHLCCTACQFADPSFKCYDEGPCEQASYCSGNNADCPNSKPKTNGTDCLNKGKCDGLGMCVPLCETKGLVSCACDDPTHMDDTCKYCCKDPAFNSTCAPYPFPGGYEDLPNGVPCVQGYCNQGKCEKQVQDLVERFWDVIENLSPSAFAAFMKANIVGTVIVLSLIVWIPASCVVHHIDKKRQNEEDYSRQWMSPDNPELVAGPNSMTIRKASKVRQRGSTRRPPLEAVANTRWTS